MSKKLIVPDGGPPAVGPYSPAVEANGFVFVSGQIPLNPATGEMVTDSFEAQTRQVLENMTNVLKAANCTLNDVVKVSIYLEDIANFAELNEIYAEYFNEGKPARACIEASKLPKGAAVEMECIAVAKS